MIRALPLLLLLSCALQDPLDQAFGPDGRTLREEIAAFPEEQRSAFAAVERRCATCHTLNEPFAAHIPAGGWRAVVGTMQRKPGAAIPDADAERIASFFEYLDGRRRRMK